MARSGWTRRLFAAVLCVTAAGCGGPFEVNPDEVRDLDTAYRRWLQTRPARYQYAVERVCFCGFLGRGPARVTAFGTIVEERVYVDSGETVEAEVADAFPTVDGLFEVIADAIEREAASIYVEYDPQTGVPVSIQIDYDLNAVDEELGFVVREPVRAVDG